MGFKESLQKEEINIPEEGMNLKQLLKDIEFMYIEKALKRTGGSIVTAASLLGIKRTTLVEKLKRTEQWFSDKNYLEANKVFEDPLGEFTYKKIDKRLYAIYYNGIEVCTKGSLSSVNKYIKEKCDD